MKDAPAVVSPPVEVTPPAVVTPPVVVAPLEPVAPSVVAAVEPIATPVVEPAPTPDPEPATAPEPTPAPAPVTDPDMTPAPATVSNRTRNTQLAALLALITAVVGAGSALAALVFPPAAFAGIVFTVCAVTSAITALARPRERKVSSLWLSLFGLLVAGFATFVLFVPMIVAGTASSQIKDTLNQALVTNTASPGAGSDSDLYGRAWMESYVLDPANWLFYPPDTAACPDTVDMTPGATFTCDITFGDGTSTKVYARVVDSEGSIAWGSFPP